ncbi:hypothetical protein Btru_061194 [Bulinus truncatus]|nr:hypothetical protein Btru_061194 [Bulinus truncatus]
MKLHLVTHGLDKEQIKDVMEKITKDVPEMTPESLDQIMEGLAKKAPAVKKSDKPSAGKKSQKNPPKENSEVQVKSETVVTKSRKLAKKQKNVTLLSMLEGADLSRWEPPKVMVSLTKQSPAPVCKTTQVNQGRNETGLSRLVDVSSLNTFLQAQHQQSSMQLPEATTLFIPLSASDQHQQSSSSKSPVLSYTTIPTFLFSGPPGLPTTLDSNSILTMTSLSGSELGAVPHTIQFVQSRSTASLHHTSQDVVSNGVNVLGSFNFPISEYTVITTDADNCDGGTVTLEIDLNDHPSNDSNGRFLVEEDKGGMTHAAKYASDVSIAAGAPLGSVLYMECNTEEQERVNFTQAELAEDVEIAIFKPKHDTIGRRRGGKIGEWQVIVVKRGGCHVDKSCGRSN